VYVKQTKKNTILFALNQTRTEVIFFSLDIQR